ncbi:MAG TPA: hypothetical protein VNI84_13860 [Pyrinomonadaceae bacterium]|nr:hypothetical protein [Pyrinomonadaceae bacterium]
MKATFIAKSPILDPARLEAALARAMRVSLVELTKEIKDHQAFGQHTGRIYKLGAIQGGNRLHQASRAGEAPAPVTGALMNSTQHEQSSATSGAVRILKAYGNALQERLNRDITITPGRNYEKRFFRNVADAVEELI